MKTLLLFLTIISSTAFGQNEFFYQRDSVKIDTVLILSGKSFAYYKNNIHKEDKINWAVYGIGRNLSSITEPEKKMLFDYLHAEVWKRYFEYNDWHYSKKDLYFEVDIEKLRAQKFLHVETAPTNFLTSKFEIKHRDYVQILGKFGVGMVRDKISPMIDLTMGLGVLDKKNLDIKRMYAVSWQPYFSFDKKIDGSYQINRNDFICVSIGNSYEAKSNQSTSSTKFINMNNWRMGVGYLVRQQGNYFEGNTYKLFFLSRTQSRISIMPELIFSNNFKQIFPSITIQF